MPDKSISPAVLKNPGRSMECIERLIVYQHYGLQSPAFQLYQGGPLSIDWTARIEKITQLDRTFVRIERA
jgi:hypothetical protein